MIKKRMTSTKARSTLALTADERLTAVGQCANGYAEAAAVNDYLSRKSKNTLITHSTALYRFADFLDAGGDGLGGNIRAFGEAVRAYNQDIDSAPDPAAFSPITFGLVTGFRNWMVSQGDAVASINSRLSSVKTFCKLASKAGAMEKLQYLEIKDVGGYANKEGKRVDERRDVTRRGDKKAEATQLTEAQVTALKARPDTPQGRRDALLMHLLLDLALRCGEVKLLRVSDFDMETCELRFYRPKVDLEETFSLTGGLLRAVKAWFDSGDAPTDPDAPILRGSRKGGKLTSAGMSERSITKRVRMLGESVGIDKLSAHDCRHNCITYFSREGKSLDELRQIGGWKSLEGPLAYIAPSKIANSGFVR